jgi:hypothetical protein
VIPNEDSITTLQDACELALEIENTQWFQVDSVSRRLQGNPPVFTLLVAFRPKRHDGTPFHGAVQTGIRNQADWERFRDERQAWLISNPIPPAKEKKGVS